MYNNQCIFGVISETLFRYKTITLKSTYYIINYK
jgi:hypothetical protein